MRDRRQPALGVAHRRGVIAVVATNILVVKGGQNVGAHLQLLNQFFPGYSVTLAGSLIGACYGFAAGYVSGWIIAAVYNWVVLLSTGEGIVNAFGSESGRPAAGMTGTKTRKDVVWPWIACVMAAAGFLRFYKLNSPLWLDEVVALVQSYREPFWKILTTFPGHFPHPLYGELAHGSLVLFGESAFSARLPAALFGIAGIFMFYKLSRRLSDRSEALFGAALLTVSYHHIYFSQDARGYTLYLFLALVATDLFLDILQQMRWSTAFAYVVVAALAAYSQTAGLTLAVGQVGVGLVAISIMSKGSGTDAPRSRHLIAILGLALLFVFVLYGPIIRDALNFVSRASQSQPNVPGVAPVIGLIVEFADGLKSAFSNWFVLGGGILICAIGLVDFLRRNPVAFALLTVPILLSGVIMVVLPAQIHPRYFLLLLPAGYLVGTRGLVLIGRSVLGRVPHLDRARAPVAIALVALAALPLRSYYSKPKQDFLGALRETRKMAAPGDRITAATMAGRIYRIYYAPNLSVVRNLSDLLSEEGSGHAVWVIITFERVEAIWRPDLLAHLRRDYRLARVLPASTDDGEMRIYVRPARPMTGP